ncbi:uncharacterized protein LOC133857472 [Alnus glutinosa]|uniref:uncharacterized protein LOC133857472 n=1 Tax=Alnus glutinosa TaxID=3517 RepID=UPI002D78EB99|nr:uncharacterized protein LOC133857472 [Alnus glutinosa]
MAGLGLQMIPLQSTGPTRIPPDKPAVEKAQAHLETHHLGSAVDKRSEKLRTLCCRKPGSGVMYSWTTSRWIGRRRWRHLAMYVEQQDGGFHRVLVPVMYFNHPLFGELLREAEEESRHQHQGGITIPCQQVTRVVFR